jgi:hypothetical protein
MSIVIAFIYAGGLTALPRRKIGFTKRVFWPVYLGEALFEWAMEGRE